MQECFGRRRATWNDEGIELMRTAAPGSLRPDIAGGHLQTSLSFTSLACGGRGGSWVMLNGAVALVARDASVLDRSRVFVPYWWPNRSLSGLSECIARPVGPWASMYRRECVAHDSLGYVRAYNEVVSARSSNLRTISSMRSKKSSYADFEPVLEICW